MLHKCSFPIIINKYNYGTFKICIVYLALLITVSMNSRYNKCWLLFSNYFIWIMTTSNHKNLNFPFIEYTWIHNLNVILHSYSSKSDNWWDLVCVCVVNTLNRTTHSSGTRECTAYRSVFQFIGQGRNQVVRNANITLGTRDFIHILKSSFVGFFIRSS